MPPSPEVLCLGLIVADHVCAPIPRLPAAGELVLAERMLLTIGGCAANAAVDLVKMGVGATVLGRVGNDPFGRLVCDLLQQSGVDVSRIRVSPSAETSQTLIINVAGEDRRFIHTFGANAEVSLADIPLAELPRYRVLYVGGYLAMPRLRGADLAQVFAAARQAGLHTVLDVVVPGPGDWLPELTPLLPQVDVFLPNQQEAELLCGEKDPLRQAEFFRQLGARTVVITRGGEGALLCQAGLRLRAGVYPVPFVDGSGGGDAFDAGYICGLLWGWDAEGCLRLASALGASCVRAVGTTPGVFTRAECEQFLREHTLPLERL
jgi:sugar/nucleoside kinase (ribokinase family)